MKTYDAIVLLGLRLREDGSPEEELIARVKRAAQCYFKGAAPRLVACGGRQAGGTQSEAAVIKRLLQKEGVPEAAILCEDQSRLTVENLQNAFKMLGKDQRRILLVTSDYHMPRAKLVAWREGGARADGCAVKTPGGREKRRRVRIELFAAVDYLFLWGRRDGERPAWAERVKRFLLRENRLR